MHNTKLTSQAGTETGLGSVGSRSQLVNTLSHTLEDQHERQAGRVFVLDLYRICDRPATCLVQVCAETG
jgi:hypothetical protein